MGLGAETPSVAYGRYLRHASRYRGVFQAAWGVRGRGETTVAPRGVGAASNGRRSNALRSVVLRVGTRS